MSMRLDRALIDCYASEGNGVHLVKHQLDSFNDFICKKIEEIIVGFNSIDIFNSYVQTEGIYQYIISVSIANPVLGRPTIQEKDGSTKIMHPNDARLRNLTYASHLTADVAITTKQYCEVSKSYVVDSKVISAVNLGRIPIMVRSRYCTLSQMPVVTPRTDECVYDYGGYFVINGSEKVVISQDRIAENNTYVFTSNKACCYSHIAEIRSVQESRFGVPKTLTVKLASKPSSRGRQIKICMHNIKYDIPLFVLFRALGVETDQDIIHIILDAGELFLDDYQKSLVVEQLIGCVDDSINITSREAAIGYLASHLPTGSGSSNGGARKDNRHKVDVMLNILKKDLLPHIEMDAATCGAESAYLRKAIYLGYMVNKLVCCYLKIIPLDDRDSYMNKRLDTPGILMANLFRQYYGKVIKDMRGLVQKEINNGTWRATHKLINAITKSNVHKLIKQTIIESGLRYGLATGNWGLKTNRMRQGVAQVLNRLTYAATLSHLRRVHTPIEKTGKLVQPRKAHATQWGIICPAETPEGASVGLVKNMALTVSITVAMSSRSLRAMLPAMGVRCFAQLEPEPEPEFLRRTKVFVNGDIVGVVDAPNLLVAQLRGLKRTGGISPFTAIVWDATKALVQISTEAGRFVRPLLVVQDGRLLIDSHPDLKARLLRGEARWSDLVEMGVIEYLDVQDSSCALVAINHSDVTDWGRRYTHCELAPYAILGVIGGSIPYSDHNQAPRNTYQSAMAKQAIGVPMSNYRHRFDTMMHVLNSPQRPLVSTHIGNVVNASNLPCGQNIVVAIACYTGFNQEDSIIANRSAIERGLLNTTFYASLREQNTKNHSTGEEEYFIKPDTIMTRSIKPFNYDKLASNGFVPENTFVEPGDVVVGKVMPQKSSGSMLFRDTSVALKNNERGIIDRNCFDNTVFTNVTGDGYTFARVRRRMVRQPEIGDKFSCYTADHQVMTRNRGWVPIAELCLDDQVASLDHINQLIFQQPTRIQQYKCTMNELVHFHSDHIDLLVTRNHRMLTYRVDPDTHKYHSLGIELAGDIVGTRAMFKTTDAHMASITTAKTKFPLVAQMLDHVSKSCKDMQALADFLGPILGTIKRLPDWLLSRCQFQLNAFILQLATFSSLKEALRPELADQIQMMAVLGGVICDVRRETDDAAYVEIITGRTTATTVVHKRDHPSIQHCSVYCCTVPSGPGMIVVRRNGKVAICGNSRHGQKGTIGMVYREEDMPFTSDGTIPSLIINPHAIPSRMTIGQLMEALQSKSCAIRGAFGDGTPFVSKTIDEFAAELDELGFDRYGNEVVYNPMTGEQVTCAMFICPTYYQRLKHMVQDKVHSRAANGPVVLLTRQPAEGRARDGGLRLGEMELECFWAHGMMSFLKERFMDCSDNYRVFVCAKCSHVATKANPAKNLWYCKHCKNATDFNEIRIPYAWKLLMQEVRGMSIGIRFLTS